jgi:O-succinylbenzoate synthase
LLLRWQSLKGEVHFGEVAPIPWFGTETLADAIAWCHQVQLGSAWETVPDSLPTCQFAFANLLTEPARWSPPVTVLCGLLPAGLAALTAWEPLWQQGYRTFKWKIGVTNPKTELNILEALGRSLPLDSRLRLDANGGLTATTAQQWLLACDVLGDRVEFLEQPLPSPQIIDWVQHHATQYQTLIALDESVATLPQLRQVHRTLGNQVVYVLKPAIAGNPEHLLQFCRQHQLAGIFSSALETPVGYHAAIALAQRLWTVGMPQRALGFGVGHWFADDWDTLSAEALWKHLSPPV